MAFEKRHSRTVGELLHSHRELVHTEGIRVMSHVQRDSDGWVLNTLMLEGCDVPFKYRRKRTYRNLLGRRVNVTYYPAVETVAGIDFEIMKVVRIRLG